MEKREKVLLGIMLLALLLGGPYYFMSTSKKMPTVADLVNQEALDKTLKEVDAIANKSVLSDLELLRLKQAEAPWKSNPFYDRSKDVEIEDSSVVHLPPGVSVEYTGYVSIQGKLYAIVNSLEYVQGNNLEIAGAEDFIITKITKNKIIIGKEDNSGRLIGELEIALSSDESF